MSNKIFLYILIFINIIILNSCNYKEKKNLKLEKEIQLGKLLFSDPIISKNQTQSCATCHNINHAFIDNRNNNFNKAFSLGDDGISFTNRNTPTLSYALFFVMRIFILDSESIDFDCAKTIALSPEEE